MPQVSAAVTRPLLLAFVTGCTSTSSVDVGRAGAGSTEREAGAGGSAGEAGHVSAAGNTDAAVAGAAGAADAGAGGETANEGQLSLFNDRDFAGWDRYLGKPSEAEPALGIDNDPRGVYSIVMLDSEPAIRISGEIWGSLISKQEFCNFRLHAEFKWGEAVWPPLNAKDSGIMFLSTGPLGAVNAGGNALADPSGSGGFMVSTEYQIASGNVGSLYNLGPIAFAKTVQNAGREQPETWNSVEITFQNDTASLLLNGQEVSRASGFQLQWPEEPAVALRCGKLQLQSEGAEIFFRRLKLEELR